MDGLGEVVGGGREERAGFLLGVEWGRHLLPLGKYFPPLPLKMANADLWLSIINIDVLFIFYWLL